MRTVHLLACALLLVTLLASLPASPAVAAARGDAPAPTLHVEMPPPPETGWTVGDRVPVDLVLTAAADLPTPPRFPAWEESWGEAEIAAVGEVEEERVAAGTAAGQATYRQRLQLVAFRTGTVPLPTREVAVPAAEPGGETRRLRTADDLALEIASVLPPPPETGEEGEGNPDGAAASAPIPEPRPARPPREMPVPQAFWLTALPMAALAAFLAWRLWRRRRRDLDELAGRPDLPPREELARSLDAARTDADPATALARVSLALRRFLGRRLGFPAAESTSREIRRQLRDRHLDATLTRRCDELLAACDLVKFARRPATAGDVERWAGTAEAIADGVERHLRPAEPAAGEAAATPPTRTREAA